MLHWNTHWAWIARSGNWLHQIIEHEWLAWMLYLKWLWYFCKSVKGLCKITKYSSLWTPGISLLWVRALFSGFKSQAHPLSETQLAASRKPFSKFNVPVALDFESSSGFSYEVTMLSYHSLVRILNIWTTLIRKRHCSVLQRFFLLLF